VLLVKKVVTTPCSTGGLVFECAHDSGRGLVAGSTSKGVTGMSTELVAGRRLVLAIIIVNLSLSALIIIAHNITVGGALPRQIVRFALTVGLFVFLYQGYNWARWVVIVLLGIGGLLALRNALVLETGLFGLLVLVVPASVYLASAGVLLFVPTVRSYFAYACWEDE